MAVDAKGGETKEEDEAAAAVPPASSLLYASPLVLLRRNNPILRPARAAGAGGGASSLDPTQVRLPGGGGGAAIRLGFPPAKGRARPVGGEGGGGEDDEDVREIDEDDIVVFSLPGRDQRTRATVYRALISFMLLCDLVLVCLIYAHGPGSIEGSVTNGERDTAGRVALAASLAVITLGFVATHASSARLLTVFVVLYYIDGVISLLRVYSVLQFAHFALQVATASLAMSYQRNLLAAWFSPTA